MARTGVPEPRRRRKRANSDGKDGKENVEDRKDDDSTKTLKNATLPDPGTPSKLKATSDQRLGLRRLPPIAILISVGDVYIVFLKVFSSRLVADCKGEVQLDEK
jgi:hypothetical protein